MSVPLTTEQREHAQSVIGGVFEMAAVKDASGRSSMPIYVDDALLLAALALSALTTPDPTDDDRMTTASEGAADA